jgi:hypothetical protein
MAVWIRCKVRQRSIISATPSPSKATRSMFLNAMHPTYSVVTSLQIHPPSVYMHLTPPRIRGHIVLVIVKMLMESASQIHPSKPSRKLQAQSVQTPFRPAPLSPHSPQLEISLLASSGSATDIPFLLAEHISETLTRRIASPSPPLLDVSSLSGCSWR